MPADTTDTEEAVENSDVKFKVTKLFTNVSTTLPTKMRLALQGSHASWKVLFFSG